MWGAGINYIISGGSFYKPGKEYLIKRYISPRNRQVDIWFTYTHDQTFKVIIKEHQTFRTVTKEHREYDDDDEPVIIKQVRGFHTVDECQKFADKYTHEEDYRDVYEKGRQSVLKNLKQ